jgi:hypothetical protein
MFTAFSFPVLLAQEAAAAQDRWADAFFGFNEGQRFVLLLVVIGCATAIVISAVGFINRMISSVHRHRVDAELKRELLDRGMSADEIAKVIESASPPGRGV